MPRDPLIPGLREYDAPRRKRRTPAFWAWLLGGIAVIVALVVAGGLVAGIGPLRALGTAETPLNAVAWRTTLDPRVIQVAVALPESGLCTGDEVLVRIIERPNVIEVSAVRAAPRGAEECAGIGIAGDRTWVDATLDLPMGERTAVRVSDRVPLVNETIVIP
ncbi:MAG: hypothetical protein FJW80_04385 [Actinobacteria bacterium]|nr:hypothetical protein [Actinomycetota bacterium]